MSCAACAECSNETSTLSLLSSLPYRKRHGRTWWSKFILFAHDILGGSRKLRTKMRPIWCRHPNVEGHRISDGRCRLYVGQLIGSKWIPIKQSSCDLPLLGVSTYYLAYFRSSDRLCSGFIACSSPWCWSDDKDPCTTDSISLLCHLASDTKHSSLYVPSSSVYHFRTPERKVKAINFYVCKKPPKLIGSNQCTWVFVVRSTSWTAAGDETTAEPIRGPEVG